MFTAICRAYCAFLLLVASGIVRAEEPKIDLKVGDKPPAFDLRTDSDTTWTLADHVGKKWIVIYFYPGDFTPGCTAQANAFRDGMHKLKDLGVEVVGISGDSAQTHELFRKALKLNFTLLADEEGKVAKSFGVPLSKGAKVKAKDPEGKPFEFERATTAARWTFLVGKDGTIVYKNVKVSPAEDAKKITEFIANAEKK